MIVGNAPHPNEHRRSGAGVAVMLAQVQLEPRSGDLHVEREVVAEAMLPVDGEAEEADIELLRLLDREDAQDGDRVFELRVAHPMEVSALGGVTQDRS